MIQITGLRRKQSLESAILQEPKRHFGLACLLPNHFFRIPVFPNSEKHRLSQPLIPAPFREFDLADQDRFNPNAPLNLGNGQPWIQPTICCGQVEKWARFDRNLL